MRRFSDYLNELEHPVEQLADFPELEKDVTVAEFILCQKPESVFNIFTEALLDEGDHKTIAEQVRGGEITKEQAYDMLMNCLYQSCESGVNDEINTFNGA